ncbi:hypothetical protein Q4577_22140 [Marinovum sp. 2_MG-2023]|uniref:hypothetical protein n=1 Tax=unclassified Marinovum TaxID=2647166 RepID=UPI0026E2CB84|nr:MULTISPECIES: hypothetical protein [unclassified Marinovum]MDO6732730.1 hypothetical protein [Marinovum sp. 2_MG-2023]MDO6782004.1 hypothetical protein [Marinovum sp. 1_MG-2023]
MKIEFMPMRHDARPVLKQRGDILFIDGDIFDFTDLPEGAMLPSAAVASEWIVGPVTRKDGIVCLTIVLPHGPEAPEMTRHPKQLIVQEDGDILLPEHGHHKERGNV